MDMGRHGPADHAGKDDMTMSRVSPRLHSQLHDMILICTDFAVPRVNRTQYVGCWILLGGKVVKETVCCKIKCFLPFS